jgi:hypothetical protein
MEFPVQIKQGCEKGFVNGITGRRVWLADLILGKGYLSRFDSSSRLLRAH